MGNMYDKNYFESQYGEYDASNPDYKQKTLLEIVMKFKKGGDLLDIGCGLGHFISHAQLFFNVYGFDCSEFAVSEASKKVGHGRVWVSDLCKFDSDIKFDVITCFDVLEHLDDIDKAFLLVKRMLSKDGIFVSSFPVYTGPAGKLMMMFDRDPTHVQKHGYQFWFSKISEHMDILDWCGTIRMFPFHKLLIFKPTRILRKVSPIIIFVAKKH